MTKKILSIISVILLFIISGLIFWAGLSPKTFFKFFEPYPVVSNTARQVGILSTQPTNLIQATSSEPVLGLNGQIVLPGNVWSVEVVSDEQARVSGLSNRKTLYPKKGMLFAFDKMSTQNFWMKDMLISIDMIFFDNNWKIVLIESNLSASSFPQIFGNTVKSQYVMEVNANEAISYGLKVGDQAIFLNK